MAPPLLSNSGLDLEAVSGICGSISIACWVVVFSPQIIENFRRQSAEGLSAAFIVIWSAGDVFNIIGAVLQRVLPTMIILAVYYALADVVLMSQLWWYRGAAPKEEVVRPGNGRATGPDDDGNRNLISHSNGHANGDAGHSTHTPSVSALRKHLSHVDGTHLSPATPLLSDHQSYETPAAKSNKPQTALQTTLFNTFAILLVCTAGVFGWWISARPSASKHHKHHHEDDLRGELPQFDPLGQFFGYLCAVFYLGSRFPQLLLNYSRKSTDGISLLFFMFACLGNLTYDMSIFAYNPAPYCKNGPNRCMAGEQRMIYNRYIAVNASWIAGSLGTLLLDMTIFVQFFMYGKDEEKTVGQQHANGGYGSVTREEDRVEGTEAR